MFQLNDGGRSISKRPKQKNDCAVRALAIVTDSPYDTAYDLLADAGRKCARRFRFREWLGKTGTVLGYVYQWQAFQAIKGQRRMNPYTFIKQFSCGRFISRTAKHVIAVIDGVIQDSDKPLTERCVYGCWQFTKQEQSHDALARLYSA